MKKRFLPFSLLLVIMILGQSITIADNGGHYVPRKQGTPTAERFMSELRANQHTGLIDPALMLKATQSVTKAGPYSPEEPLYWLSMGPDNMGGQTTAILYDNRKNPNTGGPNGVVFIGSKGGGVYKSYNYGITWHQVGNKDLMVSCLAQDAEGNIYVGTGDGNNAVAYNGLDQQGYDNSFVGGGIYMIDANDAVMQLASTAPAANDDTEGWAFVNDLTMVGNVIVAATNGGLMVSNDKGQTWLKVLEDKCDEVKTTSDNTLVVSAEGKIYIGAVNDLVCHSASSAQYQGDSIIAIPTAAGLLDIATAPSDANTIYASSINSQGVHESIYVSFDKGATWEVVLPKTTATFGHNVYGGYGLYNHGIVVDPRSNGILYVLGYNLWKLQRPLSGEGFYICEQLTNGTNTTLYESTYLHVGLHAMTFNPNNFSECYIGTDGGVYKAAMKSTGFSTSNCNRNYITTRMFSVGVSGKVSRILAAGLDHGTVLIQGNPDVNTMGYGEWINPGGQLYGMFDESAQAGSCAISTINSNTIFVSYANGGSPTISRSDKAGADWVSINFLDSLSISSSSFRLPMALYEDYDDENSIDYVWFKNTTESSISAGTTIQCMSNNNYPFGYRLTSNLASGDSIAVQDPISARLYVAFTDAVYVTRMPLQFDISPSWYCIANKTNSTPNVFKGEPLSFGISADGDNLWVGTKAGKLYRLSNLNTVVDYASGTITDEHFQVTTTEIELPTSGQCITSIAVDPCDANKVVVTLGNYGNNDYVLYSVNGMADAPVFVSKQANLPKMPIYSSVIDMSTGDVILGTEKGIYRTKNIGVANWVADSENLGEVPVMELKQQLLSQEDRYVVLISPEDTIVNVYPGVHNTGIIYAATYGKGMYRCENYKLNSGDDVPELPVAKETSVSIYPNPVHSHAKVSFEVVGKESVNYQVFDLMGRMVMNQNLGRMAEGSYEITVNTSDLSSGSYILRLNQGGRSSNVKFLVY